MRIDNQRYRTIWQDEDTVTIIDQRALPFKFVKEKIGSCAQMTQAIAEMHLRGAPLIGVAGAFGVYLLARELSQRSSPRTRQSQVEFERQIDLLRESRPTAINLRWAVDHQCRLIGPAMSWSEATTVLLAEANRLADDDVQRCQAIGSHGLNLIQEIAVRKGSGKTINILTHCNAGWLATIDYGTATAPIYRAHENGLPIHVWVDETRPRLQGAKLTAFELGEEGVPHTIIADNAGWHLMQHGEVDLCIVGTDRTTRCGDVANKIGTYLKALAATDNKIPFFVAVPESSIDWKLRFGREIPIEQRSESEVLFSDGLLANGELGECRLGAPKSAASNPGFDVTPGRLITGLITERGVCAASEAGLLGLFPEKSCD